MGGGFDIISTVLLYGHRMFVISIQYGCRIIYDYINYTNFLFNQKYSYIELLTSLISPIFLLHTIHFSFQLLYSKSETG